MARKRRTTHRPLGRRTERGHRTERGATLVEYALLVAVLAIPVGAGADVVFDAAKTKFQNTADEVGVQGEGDGPSPTTSTTAAPTTTTTSTTTTTTAPTTTTTVRPTTTTTTTTSTTTTTTVRPTTTTTPRATTSSGSLGAVTAAVTGKSTWAATTTLTVLDDRGAPVAGADVEIRIRWLEVDNRGRETWKEDTVDGTTGKGGTATVNSGDLKLSGNGRVTKIEFTLVGVDADNLSWNGKEVTVSASVPA